MTDDRPLETGWLDDTPIDDNLVRQFLCNQADANDVLARACGGRTERIPGVALADAHNIVPYLNQAVLLQPMLDAADARLAPIERFFDAGTGGPATLLSMWPMPDLSSRGWILGGHPAFVVRAPHPRRRPTPDDVVITRVRTPDALAIAERVAVEGYPIDDAVDLPAGTVLPPALVDTELRYRVATIDATPVGVGASYVAHGVVNLCLAATLPGARRRGVWEALVWERIADAPDLVATAFTSDHSRPGFARMGFLVVQRMTMWLRLRPS